MIEKTVVKEIADLTSLLISSGLSVEQNFPVVRKGNDGLNVVTWGDQSDISIVLKNVSYQEMYEALDIESNFNVKMIDGALVQIMYTFDRDEIVTHRLSFMPSPFFEVFQRKPEVYDKDEIYGDIIANYIVPFPIRFDFDRDEAKHVEVEHAKCHLTLGQYKDCRIPVHAPLTPFDFVDFIVRNFYTPAYAEFYGTWNSSIQPFARTISATEERIMHFNRL